MNLESIAGKVACAGSSNAPNTGKLGCLSLFGTPTHMLALNKGFSMDGTITFNTTYLTEKTQAGKIIPILGASAFEDVSADDAYATNTSGVKRLNLKGLPEYKLTFEEGHEFYKELAKMESFKNYTFIIGDDEGNWMMVKNADGSYRGFSSGHVTPGLTKRKVRGGDSESKSLLIQFIDRLEWDKNYEIVHSDKINFIPSDIQAVNGVNINYTQLPAALDTDILVSALLNSDDSSTVEGLTADDFRVTVNGTSQAPSAAVETSPGHYKLTVTALTTGDTLKTGLYDSTLGTYIILSNGVLYRAADVSAIVIA